MLQALHYLSRQSPSVVVGIGLGLVALVGLLDYSTLLSVEIFYLLPIFLVTWALGRRMGLGFALLSAGVLFAADVLTIPHASFLLPLWDALVTGGIFFALVLVLAAASDLAAQRLREERDRAAILARTDALKTALLQAVSHDMRTPLASIKASVTSLLDTSVSWDPAAQRALLAGVDEECDRLNHLVGNLLDMSRIEAGMLRLERDWYALPEVLQTVLHRLQARLADHPVTVEVPPDLPLVPLDFVRIDQVLTNLLENAARYTPSGTPVEVRACQHDDWLAVCVADRGPGVRSDDLAHLFEHFSPVRAPGQPPSTGLGLSIAQGIVAAHGGRITAANGAAGGLCVTFTLPLTATLPQAFPAPPLKEEVA